MRSTVPKPLHPICGRPMVVHVLEATMAADVLANIVVVGHEAERVESGITAAYAHDRPLYFVRQSEQLGTGHAVSVTLTRLDEVMNGADGDVLILPGDSPLLRTDTVQQLLEHHRNSGAAATILTAVVDEPTGYGRMIYGKDQRPARIVEERDASPEERAVKEINTSIMVVRHSVLAPALRLIGRSNAQNEMYLTDLVGVLYDAGHATSSVVLADPNEAAGVNDRRQLATAERLLRERINQDWLLLGVTMVDPATTYVDAEVVLAEDVRLLPGTILTGRCIVDAGCVIGPNAHLSDVTVGPGAEIGTVAASSVSIGAGARIGSFSVLVRGSVIETNAVIGSSS